LTTSNSRWWQVALAFIGEERKTRYLIGIGAFLLIVVGSGVLYAVFASEDQYIKVTSPPMIKQNLTSLDTERPSTKERGLSGGAELLKKGKKAEGERNRVADEKAGLLKKGVRAKISLKERPSLVERAAKTKKRSVRREKVLHRKKLQEAEASIQDASSRRWKERSLSRVSLDMKVRDVGLAIVEINQAVLPLCGNSKVSTERKGTAQQTVFLEIPASRWVELIKRLRKLGVVVIKKGGEHVRYYEEREKNALHQTFMHLRNFYPDESKLAIEVTLRE
jgi:hypothetical protein